MNTQNIILTGFMGTGKSTIGRLLATNIGYIFVDTDVLIAQRLGKPVHLIFEEDGEEIFRDTEAQIAEELSRYQQMVIATGGGLMVNERNADMLEKTGTVYCLTATAEEILKRVKSSGETRPLLETDDPAARIQDLLAQRETAYNRFTQISTSRRSPQKIAQEIQDQHAQTNTNATPNN